MRLSLQSTPMEIQDAGWKALRDHLGLVGALRFILQYEKGQGDYTQVRSKLFKGKTVKDLIKEMKE